MGSPATIHRQFIAVWLLLGDTETDAGGGLVAVFPPISVRQPRPHDIVDDPVGVCGVGTGFEGVLDRKSVV